VYASEGKTFLLYLKKVSKIELKDTRWNKAATLQNTALLQHVGKKALVKRTIDHCRTATRLNALQNVVYRKFVERRLSSTVFLSTANILSLRSVPCGIRELMRASE